MNKMIGIDLGTTFSLCAYFDTGGPILIPNAHGQFLTASAVGILPDGQLVVGAPALELRVTQPDRCSWAFKRWMGTDKSVKLGKQTFSPIDLSSLVLRSLKADAEAYFKESITDAVITVPAYFNDNQRSATKIAGEIAGLNVKRILNEPTAAALTYGFHDRQAEKKIIVLDLGGGTFDVTVMDVTDGALEIIATSGESFLGGEDFTDRIVAHALSQKGQSLETAELKEPLLVARLRKEAEAAKRQLSQSESATIRMPNKQGEISEASESMSITREQFATICANLLEKIERPIRRALRDSKREPTDIDDVILVGGATRMIATQNLAKRIFGKDPHCKYNPDEVVALGAAVQAALIQDHRDVEDIVMTDVCPHTLGIEICKSFGKEHRDGYYLPIIFRNTTIPVSKEESVVTIHPNQRQLNVTIFQGESRRVEDNLRLGELKITDIPPGEHQAAYVRFTYDLNGILEVEVIIKATGKKFRTVIVRGVQGLDPKQIEDAVRKMQKIKFYPRDDVKNRHLVLLAERVLGEIPPFERESLEMLIDAFEQGLSSGDPEFYEATKKDLLLKLSQLGISTDATGEE